VDCDLLDLQAAVHHLGHQEGDRFIGLIGCYLKSASGLAGRQYRQGPLMVLGDLGHADVAEHLPRRTVDSLQEREFCHPGRPDTHQFIVAVCGVRHHSGARATHAGN
jgi:hypothetical protein